MISGKSLKKDFNDTLEATHTAKGAMAVKFRLEVDMDALAGDNTQELGRILRYWAGNLKHYQLDDKPTETLYDSAYTEVGTWSVA